MSLAGLEVVEASSAVEAVRLVDEGPVAGAVCGWPLRGPRGGLVLLRFLRNHDERVLIVVRVAAIELSSVRRITQAGADLCFPSSYDLDALAVQMDIGARRRQAVPRKRFNVGQLKIDLPGHQAWKGENKLSLTSTEFRLLNSLMQHAGEVVTKSVLLEECWRRREDVALGGGHLVEVHIASLRKKLHASGSPMLQTVHGQGFVLRSSSE
jgi:two-component system OmpR family response regulator